MYVCEELDGFVTLRQNRYKAQLLAGRGHKHDVCATARTRKELKDMCEKHWPDVDWDAQ